MNFKELYLQFMNNPGFSNGNVKSVLYYMTLKEIKVNSDDLVVYDTIENKRYEKLWFDFKGQVKQYNLCGSRIVAKAMQTFINTNGVSVYTETELAERATEEERIRLEDEAWRKAYNARHMQ